MDTNKKFIEDIDHSFKVWFNENNKPAFLYGTLKEAFTEGCIVGANNFGANTVTNENAPDERKGSK